MNQITSQVVLVERANGQRVTYDPRRRQSVTLYREVQRIQRERPRAIHLTESRATDCEPRTGHTTEKVKQDFAFLAAVDGCGWQLQIRLNPEWRYRPAWLQQACFLDSILAVYGFAAHLPCRMLAKQGAQSSSC